MRARIWIFTVVVAVALALNLARVSLSIAQTGEDTMRARVAAASNALRGQLDLLDARLAPRAVAMMPELIEAVRGADGQSPARPEERALRAAGAVLSPEPDLFAVANSHGAIVSRRARPVQVLEDPARLPLSQAANGGVAVPTFATFDGAVYRFAASRVPGAAAAAVVGTLVDDRFAAQLKSQVDADVTLIQAGRILASSLPQGEDRARLTRWAAAPGPGYGVLQIRLPFVGTNLTGELPRGASHYAVRGALLPLDGGVQAALAVPASPYLAWLGRYQAFYAAGLAVFAGPGSAPAQRPGARRRSASGGRAADRRVRIGGLGGTPFRRDRWSDESVGVRAGLGNSGAARSRRQGRVRLRRARSIRS